MLCSFLCFMQTCSLPAGTSFVLSCSLLCCWDFGFRDNSVEGGGFVSTTAVTLDFTLMGCVALPWCLLSTTFTAPRGLRWVILNGAVTPAAAAIFAPFNNNFHHYNQCCDNSDMHCADILSLQCCPDLDPGPFHLPIQVIMASATIPCQKLI